MKIGVICFFTVMAFGPVENDPYFFILLTAIIPFVYIYFGLKIKDKSLFIVGILTLVSIIRGTTVSIKEELLGIFWNL